MKNMIKNVIAKELNGKDVNMNDLMMSMIVADLGLKILYIPKQVYRKLRDLSSVEAKLYFEFKNMYPTFREVEVNRMF